MPRPKGSKNKKSIIPETVAVENIDEMVSATKAEIEKLTAELKKRKSRIEETHQNAGGPGEGCRLEEGRGG